MSSILMPRCVAWVLTPPPKGRASATIYPKTWVVGMAVIIQWEVTKVEVVLWLEKVKLVTFQAARVWSSKCQ